MHMKYINYVTKIIKRDIALDCQHRWVTRFILKSVKILVANQQLSYILHSKGFI